MQLLEEPDLASRFAEAAFVRATDVFSVEQYRRRLVGFYTEALQMRNARMDYSSPKSADAS